MDSAVKKAIRVLVVEDSPSMSKVITSILNSDSEILVAAAAYNGKEAVELVSKLKPDIITMDIHMPVMDGFEATKQIMAYNPTPILIVSSSVFESEMSKVFRAISYGALDVFDKNELLSGVVQKGSDTLIGKVKFLSKIKVIHHPLGKIEEKRDVTVSVTDVVKVSGLGRIVAIVASTGGPQALITILKKFPRNFPCGIVIVQHITSGFAEGLAEWLAGECQIKVKIAQDSESIKPGVAYIAPCDLHMEVADGDRLRIFDGLCCEGHKPSGNVLLESVARVYKEGAVAAILTGMGCDGAKGIKAVKNMSGLTIAENEVSCVVFGMPKAAIDMGAVDKVVPLPKIADEIVNALLSFS